MMHMSTVSRLAAHLILSPLYLLMAGVYLFFWATLLILCLWVLALLLIPFWMPVALGIAAAAGAGWLMFHAAAWVLLTLWSLFS